MCPKFNCEIVHALLALFFISAIYFFRCEHLKLFLEFSLFGWSTHVPSSPRLHTRYPYDVHKQPGSVESRNEFSGDQRNCRDQHKNLGIEDFYRSHVLRMRRRCRIADAVIP